MEFDTKIKIVIREDLQMWQGLNVTAFLMSGIAGTQDIIRIRIMLNISQCHNNQF